MAKKTRPAKSGDADRKALAAAKFAAWWTEATLVLHRLAADAGKLLRDSDARQLDFCPDRLSDFEQVIYHATNELGEMMPRKTLIPCPVSGYPR